MMARLPLLSPPPPPFNESRWRRRQRVRSTRPDTRLLPAEAVLAAIPSFPRPVLARLTERMIDRMDEIDGDADIEPNGDELDGHLAEDDFHHQNANWLGHPGDPDDAEDSHDREQAYD